MRGRPGAPPSVPGRRRLSWPGLEAVVCGVARASVLLLLAAGCAPGAPPSLDVGTPVRGSLTQHDEQVGDGTLIDRYTLAVPPGRRVVVTASAEGFDAFVALRDEAGTVWGDGQTASRPACLAVEAAVEARLHVGVSSSYELALGPYVVEASTDEASPAGCRVVRL